MMIMGVDPGLGGGFTLRSRDDLILEVMPVKDGLLDLPELNRLLRHYSDRITRAYIEVATMRRGQATQATFKVGRGYGNLEGMLACLGVPTVAVQSTAWSKTFPHGVTEKDPAKRYALIKKARARIAARVFPGINFLETERCSVPHSGLVDSALIAEYGWSLNQKPKG